MTAPTPRPSLIRRNVGPDSRGVERVKQLRRCLLIHSYLYYRLDSSIVTDDKWQAWADELVGLQASGRYNDVGCYDSAFIDWDASTGYHLPQDQWVERKAHYLLQLKAKHNPPWKTRGLIKRNKDVHN